MVSRLSENWNQAVETDLADEELLRYNYLHLTHADWFADPIQPAWSDSQDVRYQPIDCGTVYGVP